MLTTFPAEMYQNEKMIYRVVHSQEEANDFAKKGWTEDIPNDKERADYKVYHHEPVDAPAAPAAAKRGPGRPPIKKED